MFKNLIAFVFMFVILDVNVHHLVKKKLKGSFANKSETKINGIRFHRVRLQLRQVIINIWKNF